MWLLKFRLFYTSVLNRLVSSGKLMDIQITTSKPVHHDLELLPRAISLQQPNIIECEKDK